MQKNSQPKLLSSFLPRKFQLQLNPINLLNDPFQSLPHSKETVISASPKKKPRHVTTVPKLQERFECLIKKVFTPPPIQVQFDEKFLHIIADIPEVGGGRKRKKIRTREIHSRLGVIETTIADNEGNYKP